MYVCTYVSIDVCTVCMYNIILYARTYVCTVCLSIRIYVYVHTHVSVQYVHTCITGGLWTDVMELKDNFSEIA